MNAMKRTTVLTLASIALMTATLAQAQDAQQEAQDAKETPVVGSTLIGAVSAELRKVARGWSTRRQVLGKTVFNDKNEKVGVIDDVIFAPDTSASYGIIGVGGFLGMGKRDVAIPVAQFRQVDGRFVLAGATKETLKALPAFEYAH